jgi:hypothetical protein
VLVLATPANRIQCSRAKASGTARRTAPATIATSSTLQAPTITAWVPSPPASRRAVSSAAKPSDR